MLLWCGRFDFLVSDLDGAALPKPLSSEFVYIQRHYLEQKGIRSQMYQAAHGYSITDALKDYLEGKVVNVFMVRVVRNYYVSIRSIQY